MASRPSLLLLLLFLLPPPAALLAQNSSPSVETILNPDGTLDLDRGFNGSLSVEGWRMVTGANGEPRFVRDTETPPSMKPADDQIEGDEFWDDRFGPPGIDGPIHALLLHQGTLYAGGRFLFAGSTLANNVARWNGTAWSALDVGVSGPVYALTIRGDQLIVGGGFRSAGPELARNVAQWDMSAGVWSRMGDYEGVNDTVYALATVGTDVFVGGRFTRMYNGPTTLNALRVARWNGSRWSAVGSGVNGIVRALAAQDTVLIAAGDFQQAGGAPALRIARWRGGTWSAVGAGFNGEVRTLLVTPNGLWAGGAFTASGTQSLLHIATWNESSGLWERVGPGFNGNVNTLAFVGNELFAGGDFRLSGTTPVNAIARLVAGAWTEVDAGIGDKNPPEVFALAPGDTSVFVGGRFLIAGTLTAYNLAEWTGRAWRTVGRRSTSASSASGVDGGVFAIAIQGDMVYIGGDFTHAGGIATGQVARWDAAAAEWSPLGSGIGGGNTFVRSMELIGNDLYVGGIFQEAGGVPSPGIARWNTAQRQWSSVGGGVGGPTPYIFGMLEHAGDLYVAGAFTEAGGSQANRVARWNGTSWSAVGEGIKGDTVYVYATSLAFLGDDLYVGGTFTRVADVVIPFIARWDGTSWADVAGGVNAPVSALETIGGAIYVGGDFTRAGGDSARHIARWDGASWSPVGGGTNGPVLDFSPGPAGSVYVSGDFGRAGTLAVSNIALWNGSVWSGVLSGANGPVRAMAPAGEDLYIGGDFSVAGGLKVNNIARFDGGGFSALGSDAASGLEGLVRAIAVQGPNVYIGGEFTAVGGIRAANVARWNGSVWSALGRGRLNGVDGPVFALAADDRDLFVGGAFRKAGGNDIPFLARWNGSSWLPLGDGLSGSSPFVFALLLEGDDLFVGGAFRYAGGLDVQKIARWSRSTSIWSGMGNGIGGGSYYTYVSALARSGRDLYAGGNFTSAGTTSASNIARWDGSAWHSLEGYGTNGAVYQIISDGGSLYVGGNFTQAGRLRVGYIARWDGTEWWAMGVGMNRPVYDMAIIDGELIAGGEFTIAGAYNTNGIARWRNQDWFPLGRGVTKKDNVGTILTMITNPYDTSLWVGGDFTVAGGNPSYYIGRWDPYLTASIAVDSKSTKKSSHLTLSVAPNPLTDRTATVHLTRTGRDMSEHLRVALYNPLGDQVALLYDARMIDGDLSLSLSTHGLPAGIYILRASTPLDAVTMTVTMW